MKISFIEIEATSEEIKSLRPLSDVFYDALYAIGSAARNMQIKDGDEGEEKE